MAETTVDKQHDLTIHKYSGNLTEQGKTIIFNGSKTRILQAGW